MNAKELFELIKSEIFLPNFTEFEWFLFVIVSNNTKFEKSIKGMESLKSGGILEFENLVNIDQNSLEELIKPSGFYKTKAKTLLNLSSEILKNFGKFESFTKNLDMEWLYSIKGVGLESADLIALLVSKRDIMPVSTDALKILGFLGYEFESYFEAREWLDLGDYSKNLEFYFNIKEFVKKHFKGREILQSGAEILKNL
ncbi:hypothetical protein [Campylobacter corcagiensis]|uniref:Endonuclease III n=1 Tax=Campylobacter corcagiensis TaxID=1448857 RepID=A0A7M1LG37_9BACT|nr:hypothetical protein [Campylobacter corcagiensis]QKF64988.1 3-methyladenine DNA glycosylase [Campylobacter corcagiensis]QOQ86856.1 endonuclease III [Campylobacter corcagiensis]